MINLNDNLMCAIDVETTGLDPMANDILEIAVVPLTYNLDPAPNIVPFHIMMKPESIDNIDFDAMRVLKTYDESMDNSDITLSKERLIRAVSSGIEQTRAADLLVEWFEEHVCLKPKKRIIPLAHNWIFDSAFLKQWMGPKSFDYLFDPRHRDTMTIAAFHNDYAEFDNRLELPFPKLKLSLLCNKLGIEQRRAHNALEDAVVTAQVYKRLLQGTFYSPRVVSNVPAS